MRRLLLVGLFVAGLVVSPAAGAAARTDQAKAPKEWDPRIAPIVEAVEELRGLQFDHPVPVDFLTNAAFRRDVRGSNRITQEDRRELAHTEGQLRAAGLMSGTLDLDSLRDFHADSVAAYYSSRRERIVIRGQEITPSLKATLAHELTHALQDQRFDLERLHRRAKTSEASAMTTALIEGDAEDVARRYYREKLTADEKEAASDDDGEVDSSPSVEVPDVFAVFQQFPYVLGPNLVAATRTSGGSAAVDRLFEQPPPDTAALVDLRALQRSVEPVTVAKPALRSGERANGKADVFGPFSLYLILATRGDPFTALRVAEGWNGDASRTFRRGKTECLRVAFSVADGNTTLTTALQGWAAAMSTSAEVETGADSAILTTCDPGKDAPAGATSAKTAFSVMSFRSATIMAGITSSGTALPRAACQVDVLFQDSVVRALVLDIVTGEQDALTSLTARYRQLGTAVARACP